ELDVALVRGRRPAPDLETVELWADPVQVLLPATHPATAHAELPLAALTDLVLRLPDRASDPVLHDTVLAACRAAGVTPNLGRPVRSVEDATVEIGMSERDATVLCGCSGADRLGTVLRPLGAAVQIPGHVLLRPGIPAECRTAMLTALA
ncbi:MAG: LysR substrate-binding domain-containing protein, partial [Actinomycetes bacterium]